MHLALAVTHPVVEEVLNHLIPRPGKLDLGQLAHELTSGLVGETLSDIEVQRYGALVLAISRSGQVIVPPDATGRCGRAMFW
jgi:K+/H+ antiporter YhaU regulatory subunit KhtT